MMTKEINFIGTVRPFFFLKSLPRLHPDTISIEIGGDAIEAGVGDVASENVVDK